MTQNVCHALDGRGPGYLRQRLVHDFANDQFAKVFPLQRQMQNLVFVDRSNGKIFLEHRDLRDVLLLHGLQRVKNGLIGPRNHQLAYFAGAMLGVDHFLGGDLHGGIDVAALTHPFIVVDLAEIAHARVGKKRDDESLRAEVLREAQGGGDAAASGTSREQAFHFHQAARHDEAFFVVDLEHVVDNLQIHRGGKKIFADTFDDVGFRLHRFAALHEIVVERADGIDADNFDVGIVFLEIFAHAADGAAGTHAANEVGDLSFRVLPDFWARGEVMGRGIHGIVVLVRIVGIGYLAGEFFRHGIVTAGIVRLDRRGADNHFRAQRFQEVNFFLGLLIRDGENHLVAANGGNQRQPHSGIAGGAFDDGAAGLQQAFFLGVVDHGDADAVFHRAPWVEVVGFDVNPRLEPVIDAMEPHQRSVADGFQDVVTFHRVSRTQRRVG